MKNTISLLMMLGAVALAGCAQEKSFEVTGTLSPSEMRAASVQKPVRAAVQQKVAPQKTFPTAQRVAAPLEQPGSAPVTRVVKPAPLAATTSAEQLKSSEQPQVTIVPETGLQGKIVRVNASLRFVVLNFPIGRMATVEQQFNIYRQGAKVGAAKVTGPQQDDNIIADIVEGEAEVGDEVRDN